MIKKHKLGTLLIVSLLIICSSFFARTPSASAQFLLSGSECVSKDDFNPTHTQLCQYGEGPGKPREVDLKWKITPNGSGTQFCGLGCQRTDGDSCSSYLFKDNNNFGTAAGSIKFFPKDNVEINDPSLKNGNIYQVSCCAPKDSSRREGDFLNHIVDICQNNTLSQSQKMEITDAVPCEVPWSDIIYNLGSSKVAHITEDNFSSWAVSDDLDNSTKSRYGSGDKNDIINQLINIQSCSSPLPGLDFSDPQIVDDELVMLQQSLQKGHPFYLTIRPTDYPNTYYSHAVIALKILSWVVKNESKTSNTIVDFTMEIMDPNGQKVKTLKCSRAFYNNMSQNIICEGDFVTMTGEPMPKVNLFVLSDRIRTVDVYSNSRREYCSSNGAPSDFCSRDIAQYIKDNYPPIDNYFPSCKQSGCCAGLTNFVLQVAYLGDFVGYDYHPKDGKIIKNNCNDSSCCDLNHHPSQRSIAKNNGNNWLASIQTAWQNFVKIFKFW